MSIEEKLRQLDIELPSAPPAVATYQPWMQTGNLIFTSGQLPWHEGEIAYTGKLGTELSIDDGYQAARLCCINAIAQLKTATDNLEKIRQIVRIEGYVHAGPGFREHPQVLNGASDLVTKIFGERGKHTRLALGINEMPLDAAVQLAVTAEVED